MLDPSLKNVTVETWHKEPFPQTAYQYTFDQPHLVAAQGFNTPEHRHLR